MMAPAAAEVAHHFGMLQGVQKGPVLCGFSVNIKIIYYLNLVAPTAMQLMKHQCQIEHLTNLLPPDLQMETWWHRA